MCRERNRSRSRLMKATTMTTTTKISSATEQVYRKSQCSSEFIDISQSHCMRLYHIWNRRKENEWMTRTATTTNRQKVGRLRIGVNSKRSKRCCCLTHSHCIFIYRTIAYAVQCTYVHAIVCKRVYKSLRCWCNCFVLFCFLLYARLHAISQHRVVRL